MIFDADKLIDTLDPPIFKAGGKEYEGRLLSAMEMARFQPFFDQMKEGKIGPTALRHFTTQFVKAMFGRKATKVFSKLPAPVQLKLLTSFTSALAKAMKSLAAGPDGQDAGDTEEALRLVSQSVSSSPGSSSASRTGPR